MYESPITKIIGEIQEQTIRGDENNILYQVRQSVGYSVDKEELLKALNYDRDQYRKGYQDGFNADKWIPVSERLPEDGENVLVTCKTTDKINSCQYHDDGSLNPWYSYIDQCRVDMDVVLAWMPLPEPYKAESDDKE